MAATSVAITRIVEDGELRQVFAATGLSAVSCRAIADHVTKHLDAVVAAFDNAANDADTRRLLLEGLSGCREMAPRSQIDAGHEDVLDQWLTGRSVSSLATDFAVDPVRLTRFVEDFFGYRLPWGLSAYLRIAAHLLGGREIPAHLEQLPLQVRYGVPSLTAAWVMALGIDSRALAVTLANAFEATSRPVTPWNLRRWLGSLEIEELAEDYGLPTSALPTVRRVALRANGNSHLRSYYAGDVELLPLTCEVFVRPRIDNAATMGAIEIGEEISVVRDDDAASRNSVQLVRDHRVIGRLNRFASDAVALEIDAGRTISATVVNVTVLESGSYRLNLELK